MMTINQQPLANWSGNICFPSNQRLEGYDLKLS